MGLQVLKDGAVKKLLLESSECEQISGTAREVLDSLIVAFITKVGQAAGIEARKSGFIRLMPENVELGFSSTVGQSGVASDPKEFMKALHSMELEELGELLRLIAEWTSDDKADVGSLQH